MADPAYFVTGAPAVEVLPDGVMLAIPTGDTVLRFGLSRHRARLFVELAIRSLNEADREQETNRIVHLSSRGTPKKGGSRG